MKKEILKNYAKRFLAYLSLRRNASGQRSLIRIFLLSLTFVSGLSFIIGTASLYSYLYSLNVFDDHHHAIETIKNYDPNGNTYVFDRDGHKIGEFFDFYQIAIPFDRIPKNLVDAIVAIEDRNFWSHSGFDIKSIVRASLDFAEGRLSGRKQTFQQGASTLTQQVVRKFLLTAEKSIDRKIIEIALARELEKNISKKDIFEAYANRMFLGNGAYGVGAAAQRYFAKNVQDLSLGECALVAGLFQLPSKYNPARYPEVAKKRQARVLQAMYDAGYITKAQARDAYKQKLNYKEYKPMNVQLAPHFVDHVYQEARTILAHKYDTVASQGLRIYTTLDTNLQNIAQRTMDEAKEHFDRLRRGLPSRPNAQGKLEVPRVEASLLSVEPKSGQILAMVGGRDYKLSQFNRVTQAMRSPGSAFKPLLYSFALEQGWRWSDMVYVSPISIDDYRPRNSHGAHLEETTLASAFYRSINTPAVELGKKLGIENFIRYVEKFDLDSPIKNELGSVLGSSTMSMLKLANIYATFANKGRLMPTIAITKITNAKNVVIYDAGPPENLGKQIVDEETAYLMTKGLENVFRYGTAYESHDLANQNMVGKTGTSNDNKDNWFAGYSSSLATLIWVGTDTSDSLMNQTAGGAKAALPLWDRYMRQAKGFYPAEPFVLPPKVVEAKVDPRHGYLSDGGIKMYFKEGTVPTQKAKDSDLRVISQTGSFRNILD